MIIKRQISTAYCSRCKKSVVVSDIEHPADYIGQKLKYPEGWSVLNKQAICDNHEIIIKDIKK